MRLPSHKLTELEWLFYKNRVMWQKLAGINIVPETKSFYGKYDFKVCGLGIQQALMLSGHSNEVKSYILDSSNIATRDEAERSHFFDSKDSAENFILRHPYFITEISWIPTNSNILTYCLPFKYNKNYIDKRLKKYYNRYFFIRDNIDKMEMITKYFSRGFKPDLIDRMLMSFYLSRYTATCVFYFSTDEDAAWFKLANSENIDTSNSSIDTNGLINNSGSKNAQKFSGSFNFKKRNKI